MNQAREAGPRYLIGIDLGTTQSAISYYDAENPESGIQSLLVPQRVSAREISPFPTLPSVAYLAEETLELAGFEVEVPVGDSGHRPVVGHWARELGSQVPARLVASAKSWLCHPRIDREAAILPWQSETVRDRISPVTAARLYLSHLKQIWNRSLGARGEEHRFEAQKIVVTVPASFDPVARNLTLKAVEEAGFPPVTLLEEPQAAFYDFLSRHQETVAGALDAVKTILVIDIGGGTTDFSLIGVEWSKESRAGRAQPKLSRLAVGPHLLIGGDNFDLTLAHTVEGRLRERGRKLVTRQWQALLYQAREVKERLLSLKPPEKVTFQIPGAGSRVVAQTLKEELAAEPLREQLLSGFLPTVAATDRPEEDTGLGISDAGLPFTRDPAITRHLAAFLADQRVFPDAVLFNGGTTLSPALRDRLLQQLTAWSQTGTAPKVLENPYPTMAVAHGAVFFAQVATGTGLRIQSGSPNSIYLGIGTDPASTPARHIPESLICLLPKGAEPETDYQIASKVFGIDRRRPVAFYLYYSGNPPRGEGAGDTITYQARRHRPLPPPRLQTAGAKGGASAERVEE
ncbi:MAG TPA: Hsp70 family protein, partial [Candidatus Ozemobacteraceae bacterium]|nr:Hsp70 family protein [Candidatus Ozemobacteraceae bacterium]